MELEQNCPEKSHIFKCLCCYYYTSNKKDYTKHMATRKHANHVGLNILEQNCPKKSPLDTSFTCANCNKKYNSRNGLWYHSKKCAAAVQPSNDNSVIENNFITEIAHIEPFGNTVPLSTLHPILDVNVVLELLKQNQEFKELLIEQNKHMIEISKENNANLMEIAGKIGNTTNNTNSNNNNTQFNLQVFLNEKCKDAVCITDFIKDISVSFQQLENIGKNGYVDGLADVILSNLNQLDITKRPLHCSDIKRDTMHIKQPTEWMKDDTDNTMMTKIFRHIAYNNLRAIKEWSDKNPNSQESGTPENDFITGVMLNSLGSVGSAQTKMDNSVLKRIAKNVQIGAIRSR